jgi:hypothetical protein
VATGRPVPVLHLVRGGPLDPARPAYVFQPEAALPEAAALEGARPEDTGA